MSSLTIETGRTFFLKKSNKNTKLKKGKNHRINFLCLDILNLVQIFISTTQLSIKSYVKIDNHDGNFDSFRIISLTLLDPYESGSHIY